MASLETLASAISTSASRISKILNQNAIPTPTFKEESFEDFEREAKADIDHRSLRAARNDLINAAQDIARLAMGPFDHIMTLGFSAIDTANLGILVKFEIAQNIPFGASISSKELARKTGLSEELLERTVRYAICNGIFHEPAAGFFSHTAASKALAQNPNIHDIALLCTHEMASIIIKLGETLKLQQENGKQAPEAAFNLAYPGYASLFDYYGQNADATHRYIKYLDGRSMMPRFSVQHLTRVWDWGRIGSGTIVDVGGSAGHTCFALTTVCPEAKFVVQDRSVEALKKGRSIASSDPDLQQRITFTEHDFFTPQPVIADVYLFRQVLHDWSDKDAVRILKALIPGLKNGARILVDEAIMPEPPASRVSTLDQKQIYINDHTMLGVHNASERSVATFIRIFQEASEKFHYVGLTGGEPGVYHSLLEMSYTNIGG